MAPTTSYRINCPPFVHQAIDGEVVLVNLQTGHYYSLRGCTAEIWGLVESGANLYGITHSLEDRYQAGPGEIAAAVERLLAELLDEKIISQRTTLDLVGTDMAGVSAATPTTGRKPPFMRPVLEKFTDMQDLIVLDPIHEVDEAGWPIAKKSSLTTTAREGGAMTTARTDQVAGTAVRRGPRRRPMSKRCTETFANAAEASNGPLDQFLDLAGCRVRVRFTGAAWPTGSRRP